MSNFKSLAEIADEYERNVENMKRCRDKLFLRMQAEPKAEARFRLRRSINSITKAIWASEDAVRQMRNRHG